jgi:hypothetical protein
MYSFIGDRMATKIRQYEKWAERLRARKGFWPIFSAITLGLGALAGYALGRRLATLFLVSTFLLLAVTLAVFGPKGFALLAVLLIMLSASLSASSPRPLPPFEQVVYTQNVSSQSATDSTSPVSIDQESASQSIRIALLPAETGDDTLSRITSPPAYLPGVGWDDMVETESLYIDRIYNTPAFRNELPRLYEAYVSYDTYFLKPVNIEWYEFQNFFAQIAHETISSLSDPQQIGSAVADTIVQDLVIGGMVAYLLTKARRAREKANNKESLDTNKVPEATDQDSNIIYLIVSNFTIEGIAPDIKNEGEQNIIQEDSSDQPVSTGVPPLENQKSVSLESDLRNSLWIALADDIEKLAGLFSLINRAHQDKIAQVTGIDPYKLESLLHLLPFDHSADCYCSPHEIHAVS